MEKEKQLKNRLFDVKMKLYKATKLKSIDDINRFKQEEKEIKQKILDYYLEEKQKENGGKLK